MKELLAYPVEVTASAHETFEAWRGRDHDDLDFPIALEIRKASRRARPEWPGTAKGWVWRQAITADGDGQGLTAPAPVALVEDGGPFSLTGLRRRVRLESSRAAWKVGVRTDRAVPRGGRHFHFQSRAPAGAT